MMDFEISEITKAYVASYMRRRQIKPEIINVFARTTGISDSSQTAFMYAIDHNNPRKVYEYQSFKTKSTTDGLKQRLGTCFTLDSKLNVLKEQITEDINTVNQNVCQASLLALKIIISQLFNVNVLIIDAHGKVANLTRASKTPHVVTFLLSDHNINQSGQEVEVNGITKYLNRIEFDQIFLRNAFPGEFFVNYDDVIRITDSPGFVLETHYDFNDKSISQVSLNCVADIFAYGIIEQLARDYTMISIYNKMHKLEERRLSANEILNVDVMANFWKEQFNYVDDHLNMSPPLPLWPSIKIDSSILQRYVAQSLQYYNRFHTDTIQDIIYAPPNRVDKENMDTVSILKAKDGVAVTNNNVLAYHPLDANSDDMCYQGLHFSRQPSRLFSPLISQNDLILTAFRYYCNFNDNVPMNCLSFNLVYADNGYPLYLIITVNYYALVDTVLLPSFVYSITIDDSRSLQLEFKTVHGICNDERVLSFGILPFIDTSIAIENIIKILTCSINTHLFKLIRAQSRDVSGKVTIEPTYDSSKISTDKIIYYNPTKIINFRDHVNSTKVMYVDKLPQKKSHTHWNFIRELFSKTKICYSIETVPLNLNQFMDFGVNPFIRQSLSVRLGCSVSAREERYLSESVLDKVLLSFNFKCQLDDYIDPFYIGDVAHNRLEIHNDSQGKPWIIKMPCGFLTSVNNPMLHKHACSVRYHTFISNSFRSRTCIGRQLPRNPQLSTYSTIISSRVNQALH